MEFIIVLNRQAGMRISKPIIRILRSMKTKDGSVLDAVIMYLYDVEKMSVMEIATILEVSISSVYKALKEGRS